MKNVYITLICLISLNLTQITPSSSKETLNVYKQQITDLEKKLSNKTKNFTQILQEKNNIIQEKNSMIQELLAKITLLEKANKPTIRYQPQYTTTTILGKQESIEVNMEHILHPQYEIIDIAGGHEAGVMKTLEAKGLVEIANETEFPNHNGCYSIKAYKNNGDEIEKTEFPKTWDETNIVNNLFSTENKLLHEKVKDNKIIQYIKTKDDIITRMIFGNDPTGSHILISAYPVQKVSK